MKHFEEYTIEELRETERLAYLGGYAALGDLASALVTALERIDYLEEELSKAEGEIELRENTLEGIRRLVE